MRRDRSSRCVTSVTDEARHSSRCRSRRPHPMRRLHSSNNDLLSKEAVDRNNVKQNALSSRDRSNKRDRNNRRDRSHNNAHSNSASSAQVHHRLNAPLNR